MSSSRNGVPVVEVDDVFPSLTTVLPGTAPAGGVNETPAVNTVLTDVLGWRPRSGDSTAFLASLTASFSLRSVEGHVQASYTPRGYALQADLGAVTGGQASLWARSKAALEQMLPLVDGLTPLRVDADPDDCAAFQGLVRSALGQLVDELGAPGGPRVARVDSYLRMLLGWTSDKQLGGVSADDVQGQIGSLREQFGLIQKNVNTVEDEKIRTAFWTLSDLITGVADSWLRQRGSFIGLDEEAGFLGTDLVLISRAAAAADEQVSQLEAILDSVFIPKGERQTLRLRHGGMMLDDLLSWLHTFLSQEGKTMLMAGRDGIETSFSPVIEKLYYLVQDDLLLPQRPKHGELVLPLSGRKLPAGLYAGRTRVAVANLLRLLNEIRIRAVRVHRYPPPMLLDAAIDLVEGKRMLLRVEARMTNGRPDLELQLAVWGATVAAEPGSVTVDDDTITALFDLAAVDRLATGVQDNPTAVHVELVDLSSGNVIDRRRDFVELRLISGPGPNDGSGGAPNAPTSPPPPPGPQPTAQNPPGVTGTPPTRPRGGRTKPPSN